MISIHALLAESDLFAKAFCFAAFSISIHALLAESDLLGRDDDMTQLEFLSTLSLRRATVPRPGAPQFAQISIHALLAESDVEGDRFFYYADKFLSTLSLRRATLLASAFTDYAAYFYPRSPCGERRVHYDNYNLHCVISIHALLAESDIISPHSTPNNGNFYPRSPCGERREVSGPEERA